MSPSRLSPLALGGLLLLPACGGQLEDVRGVESYITKIELEGVHRFKKKEFIPYLNIGESSWLVWKPKYPYADAMLPIDAERILELYRAHGYYEAEVVSMVPVTKVGRTRLLGKHAGERRPGKTRVKIVVREGAPTKVETLTVRWPEGPPSGPPDPKADPDTIEEAATLHEGDPFEIPELNASSELLKRRMQDRGYAFATVQESAVVDPGVGVAVDFSVHPGEHVKIGKISIEGLVGVPERFVRNEIDFAPGKQYSPALITRIEQTIYGMDVFASVSIDAADQANPDGTIDLTIRVVEARTPPGVELGSDFATSLQIGLRVDAVHLGARVIVTSGSRDKLEEAKKLGASFGVSYRDADWDDQVIRFLGGALVDVVVDGAGADAWSKSLNLLRPGGRIVSYGATAGLAQIDLRKVFWKQLNILGSTMGSERDFAEMIALVRAGTLRPAVDQVLPLSEAARAHERMEHSQHMGKIVLRIHD